MALTIKVMNAIKLDGVHEILDELFIIYMFSHGGANYFLQRLTQPKLVFTLWAVYMLAIIVVTL